MRELLTKYNRAIDIATAKDTVERLETSMMKWIRLAGKSNREYLAKPRASRAKVSNMTVSNKKDAPEEERTDDINVILNNFVKYYGDLYNEKKVHQPTLDSLIKNLDLKLSPEQREILEAPISESEMVKAIVASPPQGSRHR